MELSSLEKRIRQGEDIHTEFKEWPIHINSCAESLIAFANTDGGQLVFGVSDDKKMVGVDDADKVMKWVDNIAYNNCEPPLTIVQESIQITSEEEESTGTNVVVVNIPKGDQRPYRTNRGDYYIRTTSGRRLASRQELLRLFQATESLYYDETLMVRAKISDLDMWAIERFVEDAYHQPLEQLAVDHETFLKNTNLLKENSGETYPTIACLLFFGRNPQDFVRHAYITAARIPGTDLATLPSDSIQMRGSLSHILEAVLRFLNIHLPTRHQAEGFEPEKFPELPELALREIVVNALAHRDYTLAGPIRLFIYDDRVEVRTPGTLPNGVTLDAMRLGAAHAPRNPTIYTLLGRLGIATGVGSGIYRTIQMVKAATGKEPEFRIEGNEFVALLPRPS